MQVFNEMMDDGQHEHRMEWVHVIHVRLMREEAIVNRQSGLQRSII